MRPRTTAVAAFVLAALAVGVALVPVEGRTDPPPRLRRQADCLRPRRRQRPRRRAGTRHLHALLQESAVQRALQTERGGRGRGRRLHPLLLRYAAGPHFRAADGGALGQGDQERHPTAGSRRLSQGTRPEQPPAAADDADRRPQELREDAELGEADHRRRARSARQVPAGAAGADRPRRQRHGRLHRPARAEPLRRARRRWTCGSTTSTSAP